MKLVIQSLFVTGIIFIFFCANCFGQSRVNELSAGLAIVYFPDWEFSGKSWSAGGQYQRSFKTNFSLAFAFHYGYGSIASNVNYADPINIGITLDRSLYHADIAFGYQVVKNKSSTITWGLYGGFTYIGGYDVKLGAYYPSPPASFPESFYVRVPRNQPGLVIGTELNFLLIKGFNLEPNIKFRVYTKGTPDLSLGMNIGFQFADPAFKKR